MLLSFRIWMQCITKKNSNWLDRAGGSHTQTDKTWPSVSYISVPIKIWSARRTVFLRKEGLGSYNIEVCHPHSSQVKLPTPLKLKYFYIIKKLSSPFYTFEKLLCSFFSILVYANCLVTRSITGNCISFVLSLTYESYDVSLDGQLNSICRPVPHLWKPARFLHSGFKLWILTLMSPSNVTVNVYTCFM